MIKAKSTINNMTMTNMNYGFGPNKILQKNFSWDESIVKVPPRLDMQVWDADSFSKVSSLHQGRVSFVKAWPIVLFVQG